jgi:hypothetical protein
MDGAADAGADAAGADVDSMADAALTQDVELMAAEGTLAAEHMLAGQVMAERLAATPAELAERPLQHADIAAAELVAQSAAAASMAAAVAEPTAAVVVTGNPAVRAV